MSPRVSVFLPSYNKGGWVEEALQSVLNQDFADWELFLLENSTDGHTRRGLSESGLLADPRIRYHEINLDQGFRSTHFTCGWLLNRFYPQAQGDVIFYISDDDLIMGTTLLGDIAEHFRTHPDHRAVYFNLYRFRARSPGEGFEGPFYASILATGERWAGDVDCQIDGGQVAIRKSVLNSLDLLGLPYYEEAADSHGNSHADGSHMELIARETGTIFYPLPVDGIIHRTTPLSTWTPFHG